MEWKISDTPIPYEDAVAFMEARVRAIRTGSAEEMIWLLEHPPLYTRGTSAKEGDFLGSMPFPVYDSGRGGEYTYHGPGQRIAYVMLDLKTRGPDVRRFVQNLEAWIIATLAAFGVHGMVREGRIGVWVETAASNKAVIPAQAEILASTQNAVVEPAFAGITNSSSEAKIAALGIRLRQWVSYHGIAINVHPDLSHFSGIVPCGIREFGVTSLAALGIPATLQDVDRELMRTFGTVFENSKNSK
jgi:lipoyl(octanoyl) transferase